MATTIQTIDLPEAKKRVAKVNKRAEKLGVEGVTLEVGEPYTVEKNIGDDILPVFIEERVVDVEVVGPVVKFNGWTFAAAIDHTEGLVNSAPHVEGDFRAYTEAANCDHCGHNRDRARTFVLRHEDGTQTQVGSTCIKDFLGHSINLYFAFEAPGVLDEEFAGMGGGESHAPLMGVLAISDAVIRSEGWTPKSAHWGVPTAEIVAEYISGKGQRAQELRATIPVTDENVETAEAARAWALGLDNPSNDYLFNLHQIAKNDYVTFKSHGLAVSLVNAYRRAVEQEIEKKIEREQSAPVPVTSERVRVEGTVVKVDWKQGFGYYDSARKVIIVRDDRGFKVWGSSPKIKQNEGRNLQVEQGDRIAFDAQVTVSDRDETFGFFKRPTKPVLTKDHSGEVSAE